MRIVIDLQACQSGSRLGGIGRYSMNLAQAMVRNGGKHEFHVLLNNALPGSAEIIRSFEGHIDPSFIHAFNCVTPLAESELENAFRTRTSELLRERFVSSLAPDIVHVASLFEGLHEDVVTSVGRLWGAERTAVTLYDLIPLALQDKYLVNPFSRNHYFRKLEDLRRARMSLAISGYSRQEAVDLLGLPEERVVNISSAVDAQFRVMDVSPSERAQTLEKLGLRGDFLLYTGSYDSRKNHEAMIRAFARLPPALHRSYQILFVGNGWPGVYEQLRGVAEKCGLAGDSVIFAGKVTDDDLLRLYNLTKLFVFPSLREGFGLPALEAMSCGAPVIASNTTSLPEVVGLPDALFDPHSVDDIARVMQRGLADADFRTHLVSHGLKQSKNFSWDSSAKLAIEAFESVFDTQMTHAIPVSDETFADAIAELGIKHAADDASIRSVARAAASLPSPTALPSPDATMDDRIAIVTTWNSRCGIAQYSKYLTSDSVSRFLVFAPRNEALVAEDAPDIVRCWTIGSGGLTDLRNEILRRGIKQVLIQFNYGFFVFDSLKLLVDELTNAGCKVSITLHCTRDTPASGPEKRLELLRKPLAQCKIVFVHSSGDMERLKSLGLIENVRLLPQGVYVPDATDVSLNHPASEFQIATYGFMLPHKGLPEIVDALSLLRKRGRDVKLLMVNAKYDHQVSDDLLTALRNRVKELGLERHVKIVPDFLSEDVSILLLKSSDLIVYPYQGTNESSSAAVRMGIVTGVPVAVTPLDIFDDVRDAVHSMSGTSPSALADSVDYLADEIANQSQDILRKSQVAREWVESRRYTLVSREMQSAIHCN